MKTKVLSLAALACAAATPMFGADRLAVTVTNDLSIARPAEMISVPFKDIRTAIDPTHLDTTVFDERNVPLVRATNLIVRDSKGNVIPSQMTNLDTHGGRNYSYDNLLFQHNFAAGEKTATFTIEAADKDQSPFEQKVYARIATDRDDDFAWENDKIGFRAYGPSLELPIAGPDQMVSSGLDVWCKRVPFFVIDRWYLKGHNALHTDNGDGLDMYETGTARGAGGTGFWDGTAMHNSKNYRTAKILAFGPIRVIFELTFDPWDAGNGVMVSEVKRITLDAGSNVNDMTSTFTFTGASELTAAVGLTDHSSAAQVTNVQNKDYMFNSLWEVYKNPVDGKLGTAIMLAPDSNFAGFANTGLPFSGRTRPDWLLLAKVKSGVPLHYYMAAGWDGGGQFLDQKSWDSYLDTVAKSARSPLKVSWAVQKGS